MNTTTPPVVSLQYAPETSETRPWLICVGEAPAYRLNEAGHATQALQAVPQLLVDGWDIHEAVNRAIQDSASMTTDQWEMAE